MPITIFQHSDIGHPGRLGTILRDHGLRLDIRRADLHPIGSPVGVPSDLDDMQALIILGGPQNVTDIAALPWMQAEADAIRKAHAAELPVIGICLGAQLIAHALGGQVAPLAHAAIGFYDLLINTTGQTDTLLAGVPWFSPQLFSCGQEVTTLPPGATLLASTRTTRHALFRAGVRTFASLAHFECDRTQADALLHASRGDMPRANTTESECRVQLDQSYGSYARVSDRLCDNLFTYLFPVPQRLMA